MEKDLERHLEKSVKQLGGLCVKFTSPGNRGVPDRIVIMPKGKVWFVELKDEGKDLRPDQRVWKLRLMKFGCRYALINSKEAEAEFLQMLKDVKDGKFK